MPYDILRGRHKASPSMRDVLMAAASSPQLNGRGKKGFIPGFDWIMREENFVRVLEGEFNAKFI